MIWFLRVFVGGIFGMLVSGLISIITGEVSTVIRDEWSPSRGHLALGIIAGIFAGAVVDHYIKRRDGVQESANRDQGGAKS